jgi:hypothetical protein
MDLILIQIFWTPRSVQGQFDRAEPLASRWTVTTSTLSLGAR